MNRFRRQPGRKGFTMIELMVVVIVVGVLAAIAIPIYGKYVRNARITEGTARMGEIITSCKAWAQENQSAAGVPQWPTNAQFAANNGILDSAPTENFTYTIAGGGDATAALTVTAVGQQRMAGVTITVTVPNINSNGGAPVILGL